MKLPISNKLFKEMNNDTREKAHSSKAEKITLPFMGFGASAMIKAMLVKSKGNVRICTDMTKDPGTVINKEKLCLH